MTDQSGGAELIDPQEFPFTTEEVFRACRRLGASEAGARTLSEDIARAGALAVADRERGDQDGTLNPVADGAATPLFIPMDLYRALSELSPELKSRVDALFSRNLGGDGAGP